MLHLRPRTDTQLYQWSVKDITRSGSYQSRREGVYTSPYRIASLVASGLCLGSHDLSMQEHKMSELLVFEDVDMKEGEGKWPVELLVTLGHSRQLTIYGRDNYKEIVAETIREGGGGREEGVPGEVGGAGEMARKGGCSRKGGGGFQVRWGFRGGGGSRKEGMFQVRRGRGEGVPGGASEGGSR